MKWMRERDLLIAQTMAFVQSVTGKPPEAEKTVAERRPRRRSPCSPSRHPSPPARPQAVLSSQAVPRPQAPPGMAFLPAERRPLHRRNQQYLETCRRRCRGRYPGRLRWRALTCGGISSPRSGRGLPISVPIRNGSAASAKPTAARPWPGCTLPSRKASCRRGRANSSLREFNSPQSCSAPAASASGTPAGPRSSESGRAPS